MAVSITYQIVLWGVLCIYKTILQLAKFIWQHPYYVAMHEYESSRGENGSMQRGDIGFC